jgi:hypothetical protein
MMAQQQAGEAESDALRLDFDRRLKPEFHGSSVTSDAGLLAYRELDDALGLIAIADQHLVDGRTGRNGRHDLVRMLRQSVFGRLAGYEDVNDADRLGSDPAMCWIVGGKAVERDAASTSQMGRFETEWLANDENLTAFTDLPGRWIHCVHGRRSLRSIVLDMDSSVSPTYGDQEGTAHNGHFASTCYHPLFVFNQFGDLERSALRPGNVHSADGWKGVLEPVVARYRERDLRRCFRADAAFANPEVYEFLEAEGYKYTIRLPGNRILQKRIGYMLKRPVGRPNHGPAILRQLQLSGAKLDDAAPRRCQTNLLRPVERVVAFYNKRRMCEQWIREGKTAIKWTRLSCCAFAASTVRLHALAYNLANFMRTLALPEAVAVVADQPAGEADQDWCQGRALRPYAVFQMAEVAVPRELFEQILRRIDGLRRRSAQA